MSDHHGSALRRMEPAMPRPDRTATPHLASIHRSAKAIAIERNIMANRDHAHVPSGVPNPNISTENQPKGSGRRPSDTLDREPKRDPQSGASIPSDYDPETQTRVGEENDTRAGRENVGRR